MSDAPVQFRDGTFPVSRYSRTHRGWPLKSALMLAVMSGYLLLNQGFVQIRVPPGIPVGETVLLLWLVTMNTRVVLDRMSTVVRIAPFLIWWSYSIGRAILATPEHGFWALRDASQALESLFLIVGFNFARDPEDVERFFRWLPRLLIVACFYGIVVYQFREELKEASPVLSGGSGEPVPLIGIMNTIDVLLLWAAVYLLVVAREDKPVLAPVLMASAIVCYTVLFFQNRTIYLGLVAILGVMALFRAKLVGRILAMIPVFIAAVLLISALGLKVSGRLSEDVSLSFFAEHIGAIFGVSDRSNEAIADAASGVDERLTWWTNILHQLTADPVTFLIGLGYGLPLIPFTANGGIVAREPHNSLISVFARGGAIGLSCWLWLQIELFACWLRCFRAQVKLRGSREWENRLLVLLSFLVLVMVGALGEDNMEKPFFAIPYYFIWGFLLRNATSLGGALGWRRRAAFRSSGGIGIPTAARDL